MYGLQSPAEFVRFNREWRALSGGNGMDLPPALDELDAFTLLQSSEYLCDHPLRRCQACHSSNSLQLYESGSNQLALLRADRFSPRAKVGTAPLP